METNQEEFDDKRPQLSSPVELSEEIRLFLYYLLILPELQEKDVSDDCDSHCITLNLLNIMVMTLTL